MIHVGREVSERGKVGREKKVDKGREEVGR